ncbi:LuxR C-terminal-related transcriptional regulator [Paenibacillus ginsengarvi]|uniref:LuxR family transcriptional regulator n=1 Tax=Paenibacillus ginsengarvi TaxID=400777 RepID=A0A3B0B0Y8_9BACL|nr:LuxR C-terminal-related transcriptional regulator [Paenibacillus ginsengarvi]RKN66120.1 LuxR family transcriptional regulator [Paenibacillus ginsengarvi]
MQTKELILKTKINVPAPRENLIVRHRLNEQFDKGLDGRMTFICAPAGFGKTTLIGQWLALSGIACGWVSLDEMDNDYVRMWRHIVHALAGTVPKPEGERLLQLARQLPSLSVHTFLDALLNELSGLTERIVLVLDDYHTITNEQIHSYLSYSLDYMPDSVHLVIASRSQLPFPASKWTVRGERADIGVSQLQFTLEETQAFYRKTAGLPLSPYQIEKLFRRTEGWAAILQLISISLQKNGNYDDYIENFSGLNRNVADYLFQEVAARLEPDVYSFLLRTSVLERMDSYACNAVTGRDDSHAMLDKLKTLNLFIVPLDDTGTWYRYHHLFAEYLRSAAYRSSPEQGMASHRLASRSYAERGHLGEAIHHAIAGEDWDWAKHVVEKNADTLLWRGEFALLLGWFETIATHAGLGPNLTLLRAFLFVATGQISSAQAQLPSIERMYASETDSERRKQIQGGMMFIKSNLVFYNGDYEGWFAYMDGMLEEFIPDSTIFYNINLNMNEPLVRRTATGLKGALSAETERIGLRYTSVLEERGWKDSLSNLYVNQSLCEGFYEWNRLEESLKLAQKVELSAHTQRIPGLLAPNRIMQARLYAAGGKMPLAHDVIEEAIVTVSDQGEAYWLKPLKAFRARLLLLEEKIAAAKKELDELGLSAKARPAPDRMFDYFSLVRLLGAQRKEADAIRLLEQLLPKAIRESCQSSIVEISNLLALMNIQRGERQEAMRHLQQALVVGKTHGYIRSFLDEGKAMFELLRLYAGTEQKHEETDGMNAYVDHLLVLFPQDPVRRTAPLSLIEPLSPQELRILHLIRQGAANKEIADQLGLTEGTVKVYLSRIYGKLGVSSRTQALSAAQELGLL